MLEMEIVHKIRPLQFMQKIVRRGKLFILYVTKMLGTKVVELNCLGFNYTRYLKEGQ